MSKQITALTAATKGKIYVGLTTKKRKKEKNVCKKKLYGSNDLRVEQMSIKTDI